MKWLHKLLNPHCSHCKDEEQENKVCRSCETLIAQLEAANYEKRQLMELLFKRETQPVEPIRNNEEKKPIFPRAMPWAVRRQLLEAEDREKAKLLKNAAKPSKEVEELEKELGVS